MDLSRLMAPVFCFTAEEVWQELEALHGRPSWAQATVHGERFPSPGQIPDDESLLERWDRLIEIRDEVAKALEIARAAKRIGTSLEAKVRIAAGDRDRRFLESFGQELCYLFITSAVELGETGEGAFRSERIPGLAVEVLRADGSKCERCWNYTTDVGSEPEYPGICARCAAAVREILSGGEGA